MLISLYYTIFFLLYLNRGSAGKHPQPDECFIGVVSTPIIQHSEGKKSQGFGDRVPYSTKRQKKSHSRRMALKSWFEDLPSDNRFLHCA
jgi:hypothetical protein